MNSLRPNIPPAFRRFIRLPIVVVLTLLIGMFGFYTWTSIKHREQAYIENAVRLIWVWNHLESRGLRPDTCMQIKNKNHEITLESESGELFLFTKELEALQARPPDDPFVRQFQEGGYSLFSIPSQNCRLWKEIAEHYKALEASSSH